MAERATSLRATALGPVTGDNVEANFKYLAWTWYAFAAIDAAVMLHLVLVHHHPAGDLVDPVAAAMGGWFLARRRSRAVAVALFLFMLVVLGSSLASLFGEVKAGTNLFLALAMTGVAWRGIQATYFYQKRRCARIRRGRTVLFALLAAAATGVAVLILRSILTGLDQPVTAAEAEFLGAAVGFFPPALLLAWLTRRRPLSDADPACPWPPKNKHPI